MSESKISMEDMPILDLDTSRGSLFEASRYLKNPEIISAYLSDAISSEDPEDLNSALDDIAKSKGLKKMAQAAGVSRESLYENLKGDDVTRLETIKQLLKAVGLELEVQPIATDTPAPTPVTRPRAAARQTTTAKVAIAAKPA